MSELEVNQPDFRRSRSRSLHAATKREPDESEADPDAADSISTRDCSGQESTRFVPT